MAVNLLFSMIGFLAGFCAGALWRSRSSGDWIVPFVVVVVTSVWASSTLVDAYSPSYDPPAGIYPVMTGVIGMLSAIRLKGQK